MPDSSDNSVDTPEVTVPDVSEVRVETAAENPVAAKTLPEPTPAEANEEHDDLPANPMSSAAASGPEERPDRSEDPRAAIPVDESSAATDNVTMAETQETHSPTAPESTTVESSPPAETAASGPAPELVPFIEAMNSKTSMAGRVIGWNKGGFHVVFGKVPAFCPRSHMELGNPKNPQAYLNHDLQFHVTELRDGGKRVVVSRREILRAERRQVLADLQAKQKSGEPVEGRVGSLTEFGAFVELGAGIDGLVHVSQLSRSKVEKPGDAVSLGQVVQARVLKIEKNGERISLSMKALEPNPWDEAGTRFSIGGAFEGTVVRKTEFGLFVDFGQGLEGLVHESTLPPGKKLNDYEPSQQVTGWVREIDPTRERLSLSLREVATNDPWKGISERFEEGQQVTATVEQSSRFGVFIEVEPGLNGLLPTASLNLPEGARLERMFQPGQKVNVVIDAIDAKRRRLSLAPVGAKLEGTKTDLRDYQKRQRGEQTGLNALAAAFDRLRPNASS